MTMFLYMLRMKRGALLYGEGETWEEAALSIKVRPQDVLRHMPVKVVESSEEIEAKLRNRKEAAARLKQYRKEQKEERALKERATRRKRRSNGE